MQHLTGGQQKVAAHGSTVRSIIEDLEKLYPGISDRLVENKRLKPHISVAIDGEVSSLNILGRVAENSEVHFLPAIGGGAA